MVKTCGICHRLLHDGDEILFTGRSIYHEIANKKAYAIERPSDAWDLRHSWCEPEKGI